MELFNLDSANTLIKQIDQFWEEQSTLRIPSKLLAVYNRGDNTFEKYVVINDHKAYIYLGSTHKGKPQIFMVNRGFAEATNDEIPYYLFKPFKFSEGVYKSPIMPVECTGQKLNNITETDQKLVINKILKSDKFIDALSIDV